MKETSLDRIAQDMTRITGACPLEAKFPPYDFEAEHRAQVTRLLRNEAAAGPDDDEEELPPAA